MEAKTNELRAASFRLGNILGNGTVTALVGSTVWINGKPMLQDELEPIELTEEWLKRAGFIIIHENKDSGYKELGFELSGVRVKYCIELNQRPMCYVMPRNGRTHCYYLHSLQNLIFALTGEELIIKQ